MTLDIEDYGYQLTFLDESGNIISEFDNTEKEIKIEVKKSVEDIISNTSGKTEKEYNGPCNDCDEEFGSKNNCMYCSYHEEIILSRLTKFKK